MVRKSNSLGPGSQIPIRLKQQESQEVIDWVNAQDIISDSIRYLIQMDVARNGGVVNHQKRIAPSRDEEYIQRQLEKEREALLREFGGQTVNGNTLGRSPLSGQNPSERAAVYSQPTIINPINDQTQHMDNTGANVSSVVESTSVGGEDANTDYLNLTLSSDELPEISLESVGETNIQSNNEEIVEDITGAEETIEDNRTPEQIAKEKEEEEKRIQDEKRRERLRKQQERQKKLEAELAAEIAEEKENKTNSTSKKVTSSKNLSKEELDRLEQKALDEAIDW